MRTPCIEPNELRERVRSVLPEVLELRHRLHRIPELGLKEHQTSGLVRERLQAAGASLLPPYLETDAVALLHGRAPGPEAAGRNVTLRADLDALPVEERRDRGWKSQHPGCSHACGHDGHTAMLLGASRVLSGLAERFVGSVRFVFQPAEEELGGGLKMIEKGLLDHEPRASAAFALHGWPGIPEGCLAAEPGTVMAATDQFSITIKGKGGHGAKPHTVIDPIVAASQVVTGLQTIVSRNINPVEPAVISVCTIQGGKSTNVIPEQVLMEGTVRYFDRDLKHLIRMRMEEVARGVCDAAGAEYALEYRDGYIPLTNDPRLVRLARQVAEAYLGEQAWLEGLPRTMGAEDFSFYLEKVPGALLMLGLGEGWPNLHSPDFDFNDRVLETGVLVLAALALESLA